LVKDARCLVSPPLEKAKATHELKLKESEVYSSRFFFAEALS